MPQTETTALSPTSKTDPGRPPQGPIQGKTSDQDRGQLESQITVKFYRKGNSLSHDIVLLHGEKLNHSKVHRALSGVHRLIDRAKRQAFYKKEKEKVDARREEAGRKAD